MAQTDVMAFGPHPDDIELYCAGTLIKLRDRGYSVALVDLTQGELGSGGTVEIRQKEAQEAARIMGATVRENLQLEDGNLGSTKESKDRVVRVIRSYRPRMVFLPYSSDRHPDHYNASTLVYEASFMSGLRRYRTDQEHFRPERIVYYMLWEPFEPSFVVDIGEQHDRKMQAIAAYRSQFDPSSPHAAATRLTSDDFSWFLASRMGYYGSLIGKRYGEAFLVRDTLEAEDPLELRFNSF